MFFRKTPPATMVKINTHQLAKGVDDAIAALKCDTDFARDGACGGELAGVFNQTIGHYNWRADTFEYCILEHTLSQGSTREVIEAGKQILREEAMVGRLHDLCRALDVRISHDVLRIPRSDTSPRDTYIKAIVSIHPNQPYRASTLQLTGYAAPIIPQGSSQLTAPKLVFRED